MRLRVLVPFILAVLVCGPATAQPLSVVADDSAAPGDIFRIIVSGVPEPAAVTLVSAEGDRLATTEPIGVRMADAASLAVFLVGLDSTLAPGVYGLAGIDASGGTLFERELTLVGREFRREEIPLNQTLSSLRSDYDPRKVEETRVLSELVLSRDPEALHHPGLLSWPLPQETRRTSYFGDRRTYLYADGERAGSIHAGLDLASPVGTPVASAGDGVVRMARYRIVTGNTVVIEHLPGVYSLYYHLDELFVNEGALVAASEEIGTVGATGLATGPHLHWEIRVAGVPVSPDEAMRRPLLFGDATP